MLPLDALSASFAGMNTVPLDGGSMTREDSAGVECLLEWVATEYDAEMVSACRHIIEGCAPNESFEPEEVIAQAYRSRYAELIQSACQMGDDPFDSKLTLHPDQGNSTEQCSPDD
jgi:hypothetical protein